MSGSQIALQIGEQGFEPLLPLVPGGNIRSNAEYIDVAALVVIDRAVNLRSDLGSAAIMAAMPAPARLKVLVGEVKITVRRGSTPST